MVEVHMDLPNITAWNDNFTKSSKTVTASLKKTLTIAAIQVQGRARINAPVRTGTLRSKIDYKVNGMKAIIGTNLNYASFVETGTGLYGPRRALITPKNKKVFATKINPGFGQPNKSGYYIIGRSIRGMKANPFMHRTAIECKPLVKATFKLMSRQLIADLQKGV